MPLRAIGYVSQATQPWNRATVDDMVERAAAFNRLAGVTGVLFFDGARYLQYVEGPEDGVEVVYGRIQSSPLHSDLMELARGTIGRRLMPYWSMRWLLADPSHMRTLVKADWTGFIRLAERKTNPQTAMEHVHRYVEPYLGGEAA
ncbi:BLUF domain-containing protein [Stenotrophomonas bentonitica]|uniref:BLUF domain-containing protein n=1 Tax=Stenotrophomonas bentonitica TaxID=1450134 RepID=UPI00345ECBE7